MAVALIVNGDIARRPRLGFTRELAHVLRSGHGLVGAEGLVLLARAEGLSDAEIGSLVTGWEARSWPRR